MQNRGIMANTRNMTYRGHNWICASRPKHCFTTTESLTRVTLLTDDEYKELDEDVKWKYRRLKETDRELVEFKFGQSPEGEKIHLIKA